MVDTTSADDEPHPASNWKHAALATGAAMLAGLVLGRRGVAGLAAGVAAVAGAKLLSHARRPSEPYLDDDPDSVSVDLAPEVAPPLPPECLDWVDHDAVLFDHLVPDTEEAAVLLLDKSIPLLDDDGLPVEHFVMHPVYPDPPAQDHASSGPVIWEPGRSIQSRSDGFTETVWFGLHHTPWQPEAPPPPAPALLPAALPAEAEVISPMELHGDPVAVTLPQHTAQPSAETAPSIAVDAAPLPTPHPVASPFLAQVDHPFAPASPPGLSPEAPPKSSIPVLTAIPPFIPAEGLPIPTDQEPVITPRTTTRTLLPQPRRNGGQPRPGAESAPGAAPRTPTILPAPRSSHPFPPAPALQQPEFPGHAHRHLEPIAPMGGGPKQERRWPLVILLTLLTITLLFLIADRWHQGALVRHLVNRIWFPDQEAQPTDVEQIPSPLAPIPPKTSPIPQQPTEEIRPVTEEVKLQAR